MAVDDRRVALIFGASGIGGWAVMREALTYPSKTTFSRVIGLTNRPLSKEDANIGDDSRLEIVNGLNLSDEVQTLERLKSIDGIDTVTHCYFAAYTGHGSSNENLVKVNSEILDNALKAVKIFCPNLKFFVLQTGGKMYGTPESGWNATPFREDAPRLPEQYASKIYNVVQADILVKHARTSSWKWAEVRPSFITGFVPHHNAMNIALALGLFLAFYRHKKGEGAKCFFPGNEVSWKALHTDSFQDIVARFHLYVSLHPEKTHGLAFNIGDGAATSWERKWSVLCEYFGLRGVAPSEEGEGEGLDIQWMLRQKESWPSWIKETGLRANALEGINWDHLEICFYLNMSIDFDLSASQQVGFREALQPGQGYIRAFERLKQAKLLP